MPSEAGHSGVVALLFTAACLFPLFSLSDIRQGAVYPSAAILRHDGDHQDQAGWLPNQIHVCWVCGALPGPHARHQTCAHTGQQHNHCFLSCCLLYSWFHLIKGFSRHMCHIIKPSVRPKDLFFYLACSDFSWCKWKYICVGGNREFFFLFVCFW